MAKALDVYLHRDLVGKLAQRNDGAMVFDYAETWLSNPQIRQEVPNICVGNIRRISAKP